MRFIATVFLLVVSLKICSQNSTTINAQLNVENKSVKITQQLYLNNDSQDTWDEVYLTDWANSFSSKTTPLAIRFSEYYVKQFHLAKDEDRGYTSIKSIATQNDILQYTRPEGHPDIVKVILKKPLLPGETISLKIDYAVVLPDAKFTDYGKTRDGDYNLRYWFITPAVYNDGWQYYSNKNLNDRYFPQTDIVLNFSIPDGYTLVTDLIKKEYGNSYSQGEKITSLQGKKITDAKVLLKKKANYESVETDYVTIVSNLHDENIPAPLRALVSDRIGDFLSKKLGLYPHPKLLVTELDYAAEPVYGLNELPDFLRPFPDGFQYEIKMAKTTINNYVDNTILVNPRNDRWLIAGLKVYLLKEYFDTFYPNIKAIGSLEKYWLARQFYISEIEFNDQFNLLYSHISRLNLDQSLDTPYDNLIKYNKEIGASYKSGIGLNYLNEYLGNNLINETIRDFYDAYRSKPTSSEDFEKLLKSKTDKNLDWFFEDYVSSNKRIDYALQNSKIKGDSIYVDVKNRKKRVLPIAVAAFKNDSLVSERWVENVTDVKTLSYPKDSVDRFVLNYDNVVPENNLRNNYEKPGAFLGIDKPFQFKLFQDLENPAKNQIFFMPVFEFNIYDGFAPGIKAYNKTLLRKGLNYKLEPQIGLKSDKLIGSASISYRHDFQDQNLSTLRYGVSGSSFSYAPDLLFNRITPFVNITFRSKDLRSDKRQGLSARYVSVQRDEDPLVPLETPNYDVFNMRYTRSNPGIINTFNLTGDFQLAKNFSKMSFTGFYRHLYLNNRQLNLRLFGGGFFFNNTQDDGDFFSFALDRPTDYLFDYNYYGRSEDSGVFSQQIIIAEGGFKSQLDTAFANEWIITTGASTTIWKYFYAYGDLGIVKNKGFNGKAVYDTGIQVSLLDDYFELYFPIYSNNGWEIAQPNYDQKIRFDIILSVDTVIGLFSRKWY